MVKLAQDNVLQVDPNPLEIHGGNVPFEFSAVLPPKILPTSTSFTLNLTYAYDEDQEIQVGSMVFNSSDYPNSSNSESKQKLDMEFVYQEGMDPGNLYVQGVARDTRNGKEKMTERSVIATGLIKTSNFVKDVTYVSYVPHGYVDKEELMPINVDFYFEQGKSNIRTNLDYDGLSNETRVNTLDAFIADKNVTRTVTITGTHSPEGKQSINTELSEDRATVIEQFYRDKMDKYDYQEKAQSIDFELIPVVEDWKSFRRALNSYEGINEKEKKLYMRIINGTGSFEEKEKELQKLSSYEKILDDVYPGLRTAKTEVIAIKPKKSNAEIAILAKSIVDEKANIDVLSTKEMRFAAFLTPSKTEKAQIYEKLAKNTVAWEDYNNLGAANIELATNDRSFLDIALTQLELARKQNPNAPEIKSNMGAVYVLQGEYDKALAILSEINGAPNEVQAKVNAMIAAIQIRKANYDKAKTVFNAAELNEVVIFDKALLHILLQEFATADDLLNEVCNMNGELKASAFYLKAVSAARQNNKDEVLTNLKMSVAEDPTFKERAVNDLEFNKFLATVKEALK
jgi:hypothetical protein